MSKIVKHQCPSCGGNLSIDNDKQMYRCSFCGSTYDYEYFREEQMHEMGEMYLKRREFMAAADAYHFILKKNPHDFIALRGLMLAAGHMKSMDEIVRDDKEKGFTYNSKFVSEVITGATEENKGYFEDLGKIYSIKKRISECRDEVDSLGKERRKIEDVIRAKESACLEYNFKDRDGRETTPKAKFYSLLVANAIFLAFTIIAVIAVCLDGHPRTGAVIAIFGFIINAIIPAVNIKFVYSRVKAVRSIESEIDNLHYEFGRLTDRIRELNDEEDKLLNDVSHVVYDFNKKDALIMLGKA